MMTLLWNRPTDFDVKPSGQKPSSQYTWKESIRVDKLLAKESIQRAEFGYRALKMTVEGVTYDLYSIKRGAPK